ncbi:MAG: hypothetical protein H6812_04930 [Phycisphaeraceae bacterium]|nr:hypothetical protein [Phycisphaerales bacterium]MCB9842583.1 hypothetical protein [Phycisphaeraceae bacterium]
MRSLVRGLSIALIPFAASNIDAGPTPRVSWNLEPQVQPWINKLRSGQQARIAFIGDSISFRNDTWIWFLRDMLDNRFGNAGEGYLSTAGGFVGPLNANGPRVGLSLNEFDNSPSNNGGLAGDVYWATSNAPRDPVRGALSPDGMYAIVSDDGKLYLNIFGTDATIFYIAEADGGTLRLRNGTSIVGEYSAASTTGPELRTINFSTGATDIDTISNLTLESVTGEPIQINGALMQGPDAGSLELRLSRGGVGPVDFLVGATQPVADQLAILAPDLAIVMIDWEFSYYEPSNPSNNERYWFKRDTELLMDFYEDALPNTKFILASHHPFNPTMEEEAQKLYEIALERGHGFINLYTTWPSQPAMAAAGLLADNIHFSPTGGDWFARYYYDNIFAHTCGPDANNDGSIDVDDLNTVLANWQQPNAAWIDGDVNFDSVVDVDDLNEVLAAWNCSPD